MIPVSCYQPSKPGLLITPSCSIACQNDSQNSGKPCRWESCVVIMGINEQSGKEMLGTEVRRVRSTGPSVPVEPGVPLVPLWTHGQGDPRLLRLNHYMSGIEPVGRLLVLGLVQSFSFFRDSIPLCFPGLLPLATDAGCSCFLLGLQGVCHHASLDFEPLVSLSDDPVSWSCPEASHQSHNEHNR